MKQNVCVLCGAHCLRAGFGIAEDGYYPSFFGRGEERFAVNDPAVVQRYGLAFFRRPFRRNRRYRRNVCVWVSNLRHLVFWMRRLF